MMSNVAGKAYGMNVITPLRPWKTWINQFLFMAARGLPAFLSGLLGLSLIHFARWVMIRRDQWPDLGQGKPKLANDYMLFVSNFNGTWDQYIDAFSDGIPNGLDLFWYSSSKFPHSIPITTFKNYIGANQIDTAYYYNATPGSAQRDIKAALRVAAALKVLALQHGPFAGNPEGFARAYREALTGTVVKPGIQNCLASPGFAPIASTDTDDADRHRAPFVRGRTPTPRSRRSPPTRLATSRSCRMPNFDGGHYFLTVLAPVRTDVLVTDDGQTCSPVSALHRALNVLPTARQSPATAFADDGINSPFSRSTRTHFARFAILTDVVFNGRNERDALGVALRGPNPALAEPVDQLPCPYLVFVADFDARSADESELRAYLDELWRTMGKELKSIFSACYGFHGTDDSKGFQDYILRCQIETTMPFNDYWVGAPQIPSLSTRWLLLPAAIAAVVFLAALVLAILHVGNAPWLAIAAIGFVTLLASLLVSYLTVTRHGALPFPTAPNSDLPSVLKALYLQQAFTRFAIANQGVDAAALHAAFGRFVEDHRPPDLGAPTQAPGVVTTLGPTPVAPYRPVPAAPPAGALRAGASLTAKGTAA